eukprot:473530-Rhodomonas_salina.1
MDDALAVVAQRSSNFFVGLLVELPRVTAQRCQRYEGVGVMMCLPDVRRVYDDAAAWLRSVGVLLDNWLDMALVILQRSVGQKVPSCEDPGEKLTGTLNVSRAVFGSNNTVLVGISPSLMA